MRRRSLLLFVALVVGVVFRGHAQTALENKFFTSEGAKIRYVDHRTILAEVSKRRKFEYVATQVISVLRLPVDEAGGRCE